MTRQNTEKKRTLSRLLVVLAALALLSFCFLGTTFGRYTTGATGSGTGNVALWDIAITGAGVGGDASATLTTSKISPDITNDFSATSNNRVQNSGKILIATITNNSDVAADVSVALSSTTFELRGTYGDGINAENWTTGAGATQWQVEQVLTVKLYWDDTERFTDGGEATGTMQLAAKEGETTESVYIFAEITWTSMDKYYANENVANAIDTWIGENVTDIVCNFSYTATQASELPAGN